MGLPYFQNKDSPSHHSVPTSPGIFNEELQNKIEENARLHKQVCFVWHKSVNKSIQLNYIFHQCWGYVGVYLTSRPISKRAYILRVLYRQNSTHVFPCRVPVLTNKTLSFKCMFIILWVQGEKYLKGEVWILYSINNECLKIL